MTQTVLITGANRGIGLALVRRYLEAGDHVIATCRQPDEAIDLHEMPSASGILEIMQLDVTDNASIAAITQKVKDFPIDILINNAGIVSGVDGFTNGAELDETQIFGSIDATTWMRVLQTNTIAPVMLTQALMPSLSKSEIKKVVMVSSRMGSITDNMDPDYIAYSTSKTALNAATKYVGLLLQKDGFTVISINPGWVRTRMGSEAANLSPKESAARIYKVVEGLRPEQSGSFLNHTGEKIAW